MFIKRNKTQQAKNEIPKLMRERRAEEKKFDGKTTHTRLLSDIEHA